MNWGNQGQGNQGNNNPFFNMNFNQQQFFQQGYNHYGFNQEGGFSPNPNQLYRICSIMDPNLVLTVSSNPKDDGKAMIHTFENKPSQVFYIHLVQIGEPTANLRVVLVTPEGNSIRVKGASNENGADIRIRPRKNANH